MAKSTIAFPSPRLPLALLVVCLIAAGCAQPVDLENRPCPCGAGFTCCTTIDRCLPSGDVCPQPALAPLAWVHSPMVRQGDTVLVTLFGSDGTAPVTDRDFPIRSNPVAPFSYDVLIPHGARLGEVELRFATRDGSVRREKALFAVTEITVSPTGSDAGRGHRADPFRTVKQAVSVAGEGDTVYLLKNPGGYTVANDGEDFRTSIPHGVTLQGEGRLDTLLVTGLRFSGDAVVKNLTFDGTAVVDRARSVVRFDNVLSHSALSVSETAAAARVELTGGTELTSADPATVVVAAPGVTLKLSAGVTISNTALAEAEAVRLEGSGAVVDISDSALTTLGANALLDRGGAATTIGWSRMNGILYFDHADSVVSVTTSTFQMSSREGRSGIVFRGRALNVVDSTFYGMGISQDSLDSLATVYGCRFMGFVEPAYVLQAGRLELGNKETNGNNMFMGRESRAGRLPVALSVLGKAGDASATSRGTSFNGQVPPPAAVMGPARTPEYEIIDRVPVNFY